MSHLSTRLEDRKWCNLCTAWVEGRNKMGRPVEKEGYCNRYDMMTGKYEWCEQCDHK